MDHIELSKLFHMASGPDRDKLLTDTERARREATSTFHTGIATPNGELFIAIPKELTLAIEGILRLERKVSALAKELPPIANFAMLRGLVLDEVVSTNAIEDIHSTRKQIEAALGSKQGSALGSRRFKELALLYLDIAEDEATVPKTPEDIRKVYDRVMDGESLGDDKPDGMLFRSKGVTVTSGGVKVLHHGLEPESKIMETMEKMLSFAWSEDVPPLLSAIASHYIFEYIHPFYDGNGRTGRYLLSLFLSIPLSKPTVLSLSRVIAENTAEYYRAFRTVEDPLNRGELTFFVQAMLSLILKAQADITDRLQEALDKMSVLLNAMERSVEEFRFDVRESNVVFILMQFESFGLAGDVSVDEISRNMSIGSQMTRIYLGRLEEKGVVCKRRLRNPLTFALTDSFKDRYGIESPSWRQEQ